MKLIFLDIDNVVNTNKSIEDTTGDPNIKSYLSWLKEPVANLKHIIEETKAKIVIASSWRHPDNIEALHRAFLKFNLPMWVGVIPYKNHVPKHKRRGKEIASFLKHATYPIDSYVIIDDHDRLKKSQQKYLVQPNPDIGLTKEDAAKAIKILNKEDNA